MPQFSIFTPTHDVRHLPATYKSLCDQVNKDWEWVVLLNGNAVNHGPSFLKEDKRIIVRVAESQGNIGALKREATSYCSGEYLVELDHDDCLVPHALEMLSEWIDKHSKPEFLYSDFVNFYDDGRCQTYDGWNTYKYELNGSVYTALEAPNVSARTLYQIFYAPNHVRCWRRDFYEHIGGHDRTMEICDDHDLLCRTYLGGARFVRVPDPLYFYRLRPDGKNTYLLRNAEIQVAQQQVGNKYFYQLVEEETERRGLMKLDLGGAHNAPKGYKTLDVTGDVDFRCDVRTGLPLEDESCGVIRAVDFLEHIGPDHVIPLFNELWRVLAPGGFLISSTPSTNGLGAFCDPTHVSFWNRLSFRYYCDPDQKKYIPEFKGHFEATRVWESFPSEWHQNNQVPYVHADLMKLPNSEAVPYYPPRR
jgi:SAM-dependent methyltransferase